MAETIADDRDFDGEIEPEDTCICTPCTNCGGVERSDDCLEHNAVDRCAARMEQD